MSSTVCLAPILAALMAAQNFVISDKPFSKPVFKPNSLIQEYFFSNYWPLRSEIDKFLSKDIKSEASKDVEVVNGFLTANDFNIQLTDLHDPSAFYVASILKIVLTWKEKGESDWIYDSNWNKKYLAVKMKKSDQWKVLAPVNRSDDADKILEITAENGDKVYMKNAKESEKALDGFELMSKILELQDSVSKFENIIDGYDEVLFPKVEINKEDKLGWLVNLGLDSYFVAEALQQIKLKIDENGAIVKSAAAISCDECCYLSKKFEIKKPFVFWIIRPGMTLPIICGIY